MQRACFDAVVCPLKQIRCQRMIDVVDVCAALRVNVESSAFFGDSTVLIESGKVRRITDRLAEGVVLEVVQRDFSRCWWFGS